ncbi:hypothetical protein AQ611_07290 [Burkholderia singularis]|nr:hypothetical protein AQ611_07290 [Burkholderia sp. Bp7605]
MRAAPAAWRRNMRYSSIDGYRALALARFAQIAQIAPAYRKAGVLKKTAGNAGRRSAVTHANRRRMHYARCHATHAA